MKHLALCLLLAVLASCVRLQSVTSIDFNKTFVLGKGNHGSYKAKVQNVGKQPVEIMMQKLESQEVTSLGILRPGEKGNYPVPLNTVVMLKNLGTDTAKIKLDVKGETNLSMGYE